MPGERTAECAEYNLLNLMISVDVNLLVKDLL